jgi:hypothetical protein
MHEPTFLFAYLSPETCLPLTSVIATAFGVVMMFGRTTLRLLARGFRRSPKGAHPGDPGLKQGPHRRPSLRRASRPLGR